MCVTHLGETCKSKIWHMSLGGGCGVGWMLRGKELRKLEFLLGIKFIPGPFHSTLANAVLVSPLRAR